MPDSTGLPYSLPFPVANDLADVPGDMKKLADQVVVALNLKLTQAQTDVRYQRKVTVQATAPTASVPASPVDGDIVFVVP